MPLPSRSRAHAGFAIFTICWNRSKPLARTPLRSCPLLSVLSLVLRLRRLFGRIPDGEMATMLDEGPSDTQLHSTRTIIQSGCFIWCFIRCPSISPNLFGNVTIQLFPASMYKFRRVLLSSSWNSFRTVLSTLSFHRCTLSLNIVFFFRCSLEFLEHVQARINIQSSSTLYRTSFQL